MLERLGGYDETFLRAQDWELNHRIRRERRPGVVHARGSRCPTGRGPTLRALARQYLDYGRWRRVVMREHEGTASLRYLAPPVGAWWPWRRAPSSGWPAGGRALLAAASATPPRVLGRLGGRRARAAAAAAGRLPLVLATMHGAWGVGFLTSPRALRAPR